MSQPEILVHPTESFLRQVDNLADELGESADAILEELGKALGRLAEAAAYASLPVQQVGGDTFRFNFHHEFALEFRRQTERNEEKQPVRAHFYLLALLRR